MVTIVAILLAGAVVWNLKPEPVAVRRFSHVLGPNENFPNTGRALVAISPDGSRIVYVANEQLYMRAMDAFESRAVPGTDENPAAPFFSPDGQWIGYWSGRARQLKKIPVDGGDAVTLSAAENPYWAPDWGTDDSVVWSQSEGIMRVSAGGGAPELLIAGERILTGPQVLPDGRTVLFHVGGADQGQVAVQSLDSGDRKDLFPGVGPRYVPSGHIVYALDDVLFAVPFDLDRLEVAGDPVAVVDGIRPGPPQYALSDTGVLVYVPGRLAGGNTLVWVDRQGTAVPLGTPARDYAFPRLSPNGQSLVVVIAGDLWLFDIAEKALERLTFGAAANLPAWSSDGQYVTYRSIREGIGNMFWIRADGASAEEQLTTGDFTQQNPSSWSPDGKLLAFYQIPGVGGSGDRDLWVMPIDGDRAPRPVLQTQFNEAAPHFSPDGQWLAYVSNESGRNEIYVQQFPGAEGKQRISTEGGGGPVWARNGRELFYMNDNKLMAVAIETESGFRAGDPRPLVEDRFQPSSGNVAPYDVSTDALRFLMIQDADTSGGEAVPDQIRIVLNWLEELRERARGR